MFAIKENIMKCIKYYSYKERRNRKYEVFKKEMENLENLPTSSLKAEYIYQLNQNMALKSLN